MIFIFVIVFFFFFKQKTAYEMRISDWSSDVCSSDLDALDDHQPALRQCVQAEQGVQPGGEGVGGFRQAPLRRVGEAAVGKVDQRADRRPEVGLLDRKSTRLNSSH